jgi:hypothetical protein
MKTNLHQFKDTFQNLHSCTPPEMVGILQEWLPSESMESEKIGPRNIFTSVRTFWLFLYQILAGNLSCEIMVQKTIAWLDPFLESTLSPNTSAYSQARTRLSPDHIRSLDEQIQKQLPIDSTFHGHPTKVVDGTGITTPDTPELREKFPPAKGPKKAGGFPGIKLIGLFALFTGFILDWAVDTINTSEISLYHQLWPNLLPGDLVLGDRFFCSYGGFVWLLGRGVHSCARLHQKRTEYREIKRLSKNDRIVEWDKPKKPPKWQTKDEWEALPKTMQVRMIHTSLIKFGFRTQSITVVTTLLDESIPYSDWLALYRFRWNVELNFRDIKIAMKMDALKCKTLEMIQKELQIYFLAYNLIRLIMAKTATEQGVSLEKISFQATVDAIKEYGLRMGLTTNTETYQLLLEQMKRIIAYPRRRNRKNRVEPRVLKRRKKNFQLLTGPRHGFKETMHRNK